MTNETLVEAKDITKVYDTGKIEVHALTGASLTVCQGDLLAIVGPSGSGKTTFLNLVGALDVATGGQLTVLGHDISAMSRRRRADLRLHFLGLFYNNVMPGAEFDRLAYLAEATAG